VMLVTHVHNQNSLPTNIRTASILANFKQHLKTSILVCIPKYEQLTLNSTLIVTLTTLRRLINYRIIIIFIIINYVLNQEAEKITN